MGAMKTQYHLDYPTILAGRSEVVHLALQFQAEKQPSTRSGAFAFGLVLDRSGSMGGAPLQCAKEAAKVVLRNMGAEDWFSLVVFENSAQTIIPLQIPSQRAALDGRIDAIEARGSTNLTGGWMLGRDELSKAPAGLPRKLLVLTDGHLNHGITEPEQVRQIVADGMERHQIRTSCLGFGDGYNEDLLEQLANQGGGALHDVTSPEKFPEVFRQELESLLCLSAQNLRVRLRRLHYCSGVAVLSQYPVVAQPDGGVEIMVGDLVSAEERVLVLALEVLPIPTMGDGTPAASVDGEALLELELVYDEITPTGVVSRSEAHTVRVAATQDPAQVKVNEQAIEWVATQETGRFISEAIHLRDRDDLGEMQRRIEALKSKLAHYGCDEKIKKALAHLAAFEHSAREWSARGRKEMKLAAMRAAKQSSFYRPATQEPTDPTQPPPPAAS